jgi:hypothetical protein
LGDPRRLDLRRPEAHRQQRRGDGVAQGINQQPEASAWRRRSIARRSAAPWRRLPAVVMVRRSKRWSPRQADVQRIRLGSSRCGVPAKKSLPRASSDSEPRRRYPLVAIFATSKPVRRSQGDRLLVDDSCGS